MIVDIGVNRIRYLTRKYQINPSINVKIRIKYDETLIGDVSSIDNVSNPLVFVCAVDISSLIRLVVETPRVLIWQ